MAGRRPSNGLGGLLRPQVFRFFVGEELPFQPRGPFLHFRHLWHVQAVVKFLYEYPWFMDVVNGVIGVIDGHRVALPQNLEQRSRLQQVLSALFPVRPLQSFVPAGVQLLR